MTQQGAWIIIAIIIGAMIVNPTAALTVLSWVLLVSFVLYLIGGLIGFFDSLRR